MGDWSTQTGEARRLEGLLEEKIQAYGRANTKLNFNEVRAGAQPRTPHPATRALATALCTLAVAIVCVPWHNPFSEPVLEGLRVGLPSHLPLCFL